MECEDIEESVKIGKCDKRDEKGKIRHPGIGRGEVEKVGVFMSDGISVIYTEGREGQDGVAVLLSERVAGCVVNIENHKDRLLIVKIEADPVDIMIIQVYMPTSAREDDEVDGMYEVIVGKLNNERGRDYTVVMGD